MESFRAMTCVMTVLIVNGCALGPAAQRYPDGVDSDIHVTSELTCNRTEVNPRFTGEVDQVWRAKIESSAAEVTRILSTPEFLSACQSLRLTRTNGNTVQQVCREVVCSADVNPSIGFYHKPGTRAIAYETEGALFINTAKESAGAGGPGNLAHELTHTLGYTHFTNWRFLGKSSVPYRIGDLVERIGESQE